jgi:hypothetical protein
VETSKFRGEKKKGVKSLLLFVVFLVEKEKNIVVAVVESTTRLGNSSE